MFEEAECYADKNFDRAIQQKMSNDKFIEWARKSGFDWEEEKWLSKADVQAKIGELRDFAEARNQKGSTINPAIDAIEDDILEDRGKTALSGRLQENIERVEEEATSAIESAKTVDDVQNVNVEQLGEGVKAAKQERIDLLIREQVAGAKDEALRLRTIAPFRSIDTSNASTLVKMLKGREERLVDQKIFFQQDFLKASQQSLVDRRSVRAIINLTGLSKSEVRDKASREGLVIRSGLITRPQEG